MDIKAFLTSPRNQWIFITILAFIGIFAGWSSWIFYFFLIVFLVALFQLILL